MTGSVNSGEGELSVVAGLNVPSDLTADKVLLPVIGNGPVLILNPALSSIGADSHISISRVLKDLILVLEVSVDLNGSAGELRIIFVDILIAKIPCLNRHRNVKLRPHSLIVKICKSGLGIGAGRDKLFVAEERSVLTSSVEALCLADTSSEKVLLNDALIHLRLGCLILPANAKCIIDIDIVQRCSQLVGVVGAGRVKSLILE